MAARTASIVVDEFALHSLQINFDIGKSEFTIDLMGTDSAKIKTDLFRLDFPHMQQLGPLAKLPKEYQATRSQ